MSIINTNAKEIHCKILYYGPVESGKKSSILRIKEEFNQERLDFFSLPLEEEIYCLVLNIGKFVGFQTFFHVYNLNNNTRWSKKKSLEGADGLLFVASRDPAARQQNKDSLSEVEHFFKEKDKDLFKFPLVFQYNKSDLTDKTPLRVLKEDLNKYNSEDFPSSVLNGERVVEPLRYLCKLVLNNLKNMKT